MSSSIATANAANTLIPARRSASTNRSLFQSTFLRSLLVGDLLGCVGGTNHGALWARSLLFRATPVGQLINHDLYFSAGLVVPRARRCHG